MATTGTSNTDLARAEILWKAADALRGQIDAAEYKHVILGLLFLKYISDSFDARRGIAPEKMNELIKLIADIGFKGDRSKARDTLGRVYEYFLSKFAFAEGKLGGEFFTPRSIVRLLVEMLEPCEGRVYDPCCGSAGMFVKSERFVQAHGGQKTDLSIFGQESNPTTWRLAHMNLAIRGIEANLGPQPAHSFLAICTRTSRPTTSSPIRRSTSRTGRANCWPTTRAGVTAPRPRATPTARGSSTSSTTWRRPVVEAAAMARACWWTA